MRCGRTWNALPLHSLAPITLLLPHFTLHLSTSNTISDIIPNHTTFHITLSFLTISHQHLGHAAHYSTLQYQISNRTISATLCITPHLVLHPIFILLTYHITPHFRPRHTSFMHRTIILHKTLHRISHALQLASFHHIWLWSHQQAIPHPITMFRIAFHITHQYTTTFYISPLITTSRTIPLPRIALYHTLPHYHIAQRSTFHATARTSPYYTTTFHNPLPVWETISYSLSNWKGIMESCGTLWQLSIKCQKS